MVVTHAGVADAAEGRGMIEHVPAPIVNRYTARVCPAQQTLPCIGFMTKAVQCQRPRLALDVAHDLLFGIVGNDRQDRAENLLLHHDHLGGTVCDDMQWDAASGSLAAARNDVRPFSSGIFEQASD